LLFFGDDRRLRIVLAGYEDEDATHMPPSWRCLAWKANRSYGASGGDTENSEDRHKERLAFSPGCLAPGQPTVF
jgi:hypothetical protein